jgi:hypothetical protein
MNIREVIVVAHQSEIQVYAGDTGYVVIKQVNEMEDDDLIFIDPLHVDAICEALQAAKKDAVEFRAEWVKEGDNEPA